MFAGEFPPQRFSRLFLELVLPFEAPVVLSILKLLAVIYLDTYWSFSYLGLKSVLFVFSLS